MPLTGRHVNAQASGVAARRTVRERAGVVVTRRAKRCAALAAHSVCWLRVKETAEHGAGAPEPASRADAGGGSWRRGASGGRAGTAQV